MKQSRRKYSSAFKAKVAIEAIKERESLSELAMKFKVSQSQICKWKKSFLEQSSTVFDGSSSKKEDSDLVAPEELYKKIGKLEMEKEFLKKNLKKLGL